MKFGVVSKEVEYPDTTLERDFVTKRVTAVLLTALIMKTTTTATTYNVGTCSNIE